MKGVNHLKFLMTLTASNLILAGNRAAQELTDLLSQEKAEVVKG